MINSDTSAGWRTVASWGGAGGAAGDEKGEWKSWSPRGEIAPRFSRERGLEISGCDDPACYGSWQLAVERVTAGSAYQLRATCSAESVTLPARSIFARLHWFDAKGERLRPHDNASLKSIGGGREFELEHTTLAPPDALRVVIELGFRWSGGAVRWTGMSFENAPKLTPRPVRIAGVFHRPRNTASREESVRQFCDIITSKSCAGCDLICLPEGITVIGTGKTYADVAEPLNGPTAAALSEAAGRQKAYVVAGIYERDGKRIYNTAVLIDRAGKLVGSYRKAYLPQEESDAGLTPGDDLPVFETDFGKVGIMVCWDVQYPEPARGLAAAGAEVIALPIWGGSELLTRARAIENHVFVVTSSYDMRTMVVDPAGEVLADAPTEPGVAAATVDLAAPVLQLPWLGDLKSRATAERRDDLRRSAD